MEVTKTLNISTRYDKRIFQAIEKKMLEMEDKTGKKVSVSAAVVEILIEYQENNKQDDNRNHSGNHSRMGDKG